MTNQTASVIRRPFRIRISVTAKELELIRIAAAKEGLRPTSYVYRVAVDAALRAA
jgi:uncharacterized protein (DUF1778 family)